MKITFKLLHDLLFVLVIFFILALIGDGLLPGIVSERVGLYAIALLIMIDVFTINILSKFFPDDIAQVNKKTAYAFLAVLLLLVFNSLIKVNIFLNLFILSVIVISAFFTDKVFAEK